MFDLPYYFISPVALFHQRSTTASIMLVLLCLVLQFLAFANGLPLRKSVNIGDLSFATQTAAETYVRDLLGEIGYCKSVTSQGPQYFERIMDIAKLHPRASEKLQDVSDFCIVRNKLSNYREKAYELNIVRADSSLLDISWKKCVANNYKAGVKEMLSSAFRFSVESQIDNFRKNSTKVCEICYKKLGSTVSHVDHVIQFDDLMKSFLLLNTLPLPSRFVDCPDGSNRMVFHIDSQQLSENFARYHEETAVLRMTCPQCNLRRKRKAP